MLTTDRVNPLSTKPIKNPTLIEEKPKIERDDKLWFDIPEWLHEFRENLEDDEIPVHGGSHASSSHEASLEQIFKRCEDLGKHNVHTHFPKDRNCEICKKDPNYKGSMQKTQWRSRTSR